MFWTLVTLIYSRTWEFVGTPYILFFSKEELRRIQILLQYIPKSSLCSLQSTRNVQELRQEPREELSRSQVLLQYIPKSSLFSLQSTIFLKWHGTAKIPALMKLTHKCKLPDLQCEICGNQTSLREHRNLLSPDRLAIQTLVPFTVLWQRHHPFQILNCVTTYICLFYYSLFLRIFNFFM